MPTTVQTSRLLGSALLLAAIFCSGCATIDNDRLVVAGMEPPELASGDEPYAAPMREATGPSLTGIDRSHWPEQEILVMQDGVHHHPRFTSNGPRYTNETARQRGEYPTAGSALELGGDCEAQVWEALAGPVWAGMDVVLFIPRAITRGGPGALVASPDDTYARAAGTTAPSLEAAVAPINDQPAR